MITVQLTKNEFEIMLMALDRASAAWTDASEKTKSRDTEIYLSELAADADKLQEKVKAAGDHLNDQPSFNSVGAT